MAFYPHELIQNVYSLFIFFFRKQLYSQMLHLNCFSSWTNATCVFNHLTLSRTAVITNVAFEWLFFFMDETCIFKLLFPRLFLLCYIYFLEKFITPFFNWPLFFRSKDEYECRESEEILQSSDNSSRPISAMKIRPPLPGSKIDNLRNTIEKQVGIILTKKVLLKSLVWFSPLINFSWKLNV